MTEFHGSVLECIAFLSTQTDGEFEVREYRPKRSLSANALYFKMCSEMAKALRISVPFMHNQLLRRYGVLWESDGQEIWVAVPNTAEAERNADENEETHLKPTSKIFKSKRWYLLLKPSHEFNSSEMSRLIDGTADEMRQMGLTPPMDEDIKRALEKMEKKENG